MGSCSILEAQCIVYSSAERWEYCIWLNRAGLLHAVEQRGRAYGIHLDQALTNLNSSSLCREQYSGWKHLEGESYSGHFLQTLSTSTYGPGRKSLPFSRGCEARVLDMAVPTSTICAHPLRAPTPLMTFFLMEEK